MSGTGSQDRGAPDMAQPVNGTGDPCTGQTGPLRAGKDGDFHNVSTAGDLGCGKSSPKGAFGGLAAANGMGKPHRSLRTHLWTNLWTTSCGWRSLRENLSRPGHDCEARGATGERRRFG